ncbi:MAG: tRNA (N6-threonylcarbamoyladenosine(37)-N6)-methyltransferase TrmO [Geminicoccaceae bacterium]|nr:MAG: tRNA (N6-threonylcarbamoyladenosine(37)-N6)-methyltransferase TrmO [Geminicoccaceae bacterium]
MQQEVGQRAGERLGEDMGQRPPDAGLVFIGRIRTPWRTRSDCPKNTASSAALCQVELAAEFAPALDGLAGTSHVIVLYWLDRARRDYLVQAPSHAPYPLGTFALRSPNRPNPIGVGIVPLCRIDGHVLEVQGLDCLDGTPLLDVKPYLANTDSHPAAVVGWRRSG